MKTPIPSIRDLRKICQRPPETETVTYARYVIRPFSIYITWVLVHMPITANQVTVAQAVFGVAGAALLAFGSTSLAILALVLIHFGYILDCVDGEVARFRKTSNIFGVFLDYLNHVLVTPAIYWGATIFSYGLNGNVWVLWTMVLLSFIIVSPTKQSFVTTIYHMFERRSDPRYDTSRHNSFESSEGQRADFSKERENQLFTFLQGMANYPGSMNVLSIAVLLDIFLPTSGNITFGALIMLLVLRMGGEFLFLLKTKRRNRIHRLYAEFRSLGMNAPSSTNSHDSQQLHRTSEQ